MNRIRRALIKSVVAYVAISAALSVCASVAGNPWPVIRARAPFTVVQAVTCTPDTVRADGIAEGVDNRGEHVAYGAEYISKKMVTLFVFNPFSDATDDIIARIDLHG